MILPCDICGRDVDDNDECAACGHNTTAPDCWCPACEAFELACWKREQAEAAGL